MSGNHKNPQKITMRLFNWWNIKKPIYDSLTKKERLAVDIFFASIPSSSTEMISTWLGKNPEDGGMVVMPYNQLNRLVWRCIEVAKGRVEVPEEVLELLAPHKLNQ